MNTGWPDEHEAAWFAAVHRTLLKLYDETDPLDAAEYWYFLSAGYNNMPPWGKRKWLIWAEKRADAGDERFTLLFTRLAVLRMTQ